LSTIQTFIYRGLRLWECPGSRPQSGPGWIMRHYFWACRALSFSFPAILFVSLHVIWYCINFRLVRSTEMRIFFFLLHISSPLSFRHPVL
jgi:hypothetical protein